MSDVAPEQVVEPAAIHLLGLHRPGWRLPLSEGLLRFLGQNEVAQAAGWIGQRRGHRVQAVKPECAARGVRRARPVGALEVVARPIMLRSIVKRLALRAWAATATVLARRMLSLTAALALARSLLLAVIGTAVGPRRSAGTAARAWRAWAAAVSIGMGRFHRRRV